MSMKWRTAVTLWLGAVTAMAMNLQTDVHTQSGPNPYRPVDGLQTYCDNSDLNPILRFDPQGNVVAQFASRMFSWPHGIHIDRDGNVWVTEAGNGQQTPGAPGPAKPVGHQVFTFSPQGRLLMTLGEAGVPGSDASHFNAPSDVITDPNGDIFVVDGHGSNGNNRIVKLSKDGTFIKAFGTTDA